MKRERLPGPISKAYFRQTHEEDILLGRRIFAQLFQTYTVGS